MATLAYRDILRNANANQHFKTVSSISTDHRTGDSAGDLISEVYLRIRSLLFSIVCFVRFNFMGLYRSFIDPNPDLGYPFLGK